MNIMRGKDIRKWRPLNQRVVNKSDIYIYIIYELKLILSAIRIDKTIRVKT